MTVKALLGSRWINSGHQSSQHPNQNNSEAADDIDSETSLRLSIKELLNVSSDWKDVNNLRGGQGGAAGGFPGQEPLSQDF